MPNGPRNPTFFTLAVPHATHLRLLCSSPHHTPSPSPSPLFITALRYDDTNPEAEKKEYIHHIEEIVQWMGWKPFKITYTSDYFKELYELAVELIKSGHAYVDHQTSNEIKEYRDKKLNNPWRDRPISESLKIVEDLRRGLIEEGKATLRMKQDMQSENDNMYDLIAYQMHLSMIECSRVVPIYLEISVYSKYCVMRVFYYLTRAIETWLGSTGGYFFLHLLKNSDESADRGLLISYY